MSEIPQWIEEGERGYVISLPGGGEGESLAEFEIDGKNYICPSLMVHWINPDEEVNPWFKSNWDNLGIWNERVAAANDVAVFLLEAYEQAKPTKNDL